MLSKKISFTFFVAQSPALINKTQTMDERTRYRAMPMGCNPGTRLGHKQTQSLLNRIQHHLSRNKNV